MRMHKQALLSLLLLLVAAVSCNSISKVAPSEAELIEVPYDYKSIQEAINNANPGNTIFVYNGTYYEHVIINKSLSLIGQNVEITTIDGSGTGTAIHISANNVKVQGFTVRNGETGIHLKNCNTIIIEETRIENNIFDGIKMESSINTTIRRNTIEKISQNAIYLLNSSSNVIVYNNITCDSRWSYGILLYHSNNNTINHNSVKGTAPEGNEGGIGLLYSYNNSISNNFISNNNWCGISLRYSNNTLVWGNTIIGHKWFGVRLTYSYHNIIYCNNFVDNNYQASLENANATWYFMNLGNYWSGYEGQDLEPDGVGDKPYEIDTKNIDRFPLMGKFFEFTTLTEMEQKVKVQIVSNSTISNFRFIKYFRPERGQNISLIKFTSTVDSNCTSFCRITIPHLLLQGPYEVLVNGTPPIMLREIASTATYTTLYFTYINSNQVIIVPEWSMIFFYLFSMIDTVLLIAAVKKKFRF